jgi:adenosylcobinamide amidohydrolase
MISSAVLGGGIGPGEWVLNAQVDAGYSRTDPVEHLRELAPPGPGVGMLTAASVAHYTRAADHGAEVVATVGLRVPTWAASPEGATDPELRPLTDHEPRPLADPESRSQTGAAARPRSGTDRETRLLSTAEPEPRPPAPRPGTINIIVAVPVAMSDAALVNAVMTVTEAKTQALIEAGYACTGTASDAVCLAVPSGGSPEPFGGPRSLWGARNARATHAAGLDGALAWGRVNGVASPAPSRGGPAGRGR